MNSTKVDKNCAKAQKKLNKLNKKQASKQQQQQQQLQQDVAHKTAAATATPATITPNFVVNKVTGKTIRIPSTANTTNAADTTTITNNYNNNNSQHIQNHNLPANVALDAPKFERSNSFSLKGKISKLFNSITGSKENLQKIEDDSATLYKFTRSRSMILLRRPNRRSLIEPQLEQLSEEVEKTVDGATSPASPRKNSLEAENTNCNTTTSNKPVTPTDLANRLCAEKTYYNSRRQSAQVHSSPPIIDECFKPLKRKTSLVSLKADKTTVGSPPAFDPILNFQKRRSSTLIASFKSTFSGLTGSNADEKRKEKLNPKWSASLQSLQAIDNMVSYENMSFIDYDKLSGYEKTLERQLSCLSLAGAAAATQNGIADNCAAPIAKLPIAAVNTSTPTASSTNSSFQTPQTVVRRRRRTNTDTAQKRAHARNSFNFDTNYEHNLDKYRNVYRDSLDSRKLEILNDLSLNTPVVPDKRLFDVLHLEDGHVGRRKSAHARSTANTNDHVDGATTHTQLKSKSLTHLDGIESMFAGAESNSTEGHNIATSSSDEHFSVSFCNEDGSIDRELIPITKGATLSNALSDSLKRRNLSFSQITVTENNATLYLLETGNSPLTSNYHEHSNVELLAGRNLFVLEKDGSRKILQKASSFSSRSRPPRLLSSASTEESNEAIAAGGKHFKQRWSGIFGLKNPQQSQLCELLNAFAKNGVPHRSFSLNFQHPEFKAALTYLDNMHKTWMDFVHTQHLSESDVRVQTAVWELVTTEVYYIHALQTVTDLFLACLEAVQEQQLLNEVDQHKLFSNVRDICEANLKFWTYYLYPMVAHSILTQEPLKMSFFQPGFESFANIFAPYKKYCAEQSTCQFYCKELNRSNALFTAYLAWCESQKMCNRLRLADILVRPMQRLTKYGLLLAAIKKHLTDVEDIDKIDSMIHTVENFVFSVNNHLTSRQENERLKGVMARIECYDVVDANNEHLDKMVKQYSAMFDLCAPMKGCAQQHVRHLFMEGDHKFKDNFGKIDVHCFLMTDVLLICKTVAKKGLGALKIIRQPYLTDRLIVHRQNNTLNCIYLNEFEVAIAAFTLQCLEAKNWHEALKRAKMLYTTLKQSIGSNASGGSTVDALGVRKSPLNSSMCSHMSSTNNSYSGSVEWNESRNISVDFEKANSLSSDEGTAFTAAHGNALKARNNAAATIAPKPKVHAGISANTLSVQTPLNHLGQSLPNLNTHQCQT